MNLPPTVLVLIWLALGAAVAWLIAGARFRSQRERFRSELRRARDAMEQQTNASAARVASAETAAAAEREQREQIGVRLHEAEYARAEMDKLRAVAEERHAKALELIEEQKAFIAASRQEMENAFKALAAEALKGSSDQFLELAEQRWATTREQAAKDLDDRTRAIETLLSPLKETLGKLEVRAGAIEEARVGAYAKMDEQVRQLARQTAALQEKTTSLVTALRGSQVRGRWGEIALRNIAELAGMTEHCDFEEQETIADGGRPDMIVRLPGGRFIAVDSKTPLNAYLDANQAADEVARDAALDRHVAALRTHVRSLAARGYAAGLDGDVDLVVMFLPGDPFLAAAFSRDPDLQVDALRSKVLIATPTTLVALLRTVAVYWQQRSLAENAEAIADAARELYERAAKFGDELSMVGKGLRTALEAYNRAVGSFDARLLPMGRQLEEMKVTEHARRDLEAPRPVDDLPREVRGPIQPH